MRRHLVFAVMPAVVLLATEASAQLGPAQGPPIVPPTPIVAPDSPIAVAFDPAALVFLNHPGLYYAHGVAPDGARAMSSGDSVYAAGSIRGRVGLGLGFEHANPVVGSSYGRFSLGLATAPGRRGSIGLALRHVAVPGGVDSTTVDLAASVRPSPMLGLAFVASNVLGPAGLAATGGRTMPAVFTAAAMWRPLGTPDVAFESAVIIDTDGRLGGRFYGGVAIRDFVRLTGLFEVGHVGGILDQRGLVGAELFYSALRVSGGATLASPSQSAGYYVGGGFDFGARHAPSVPPRHVLDLDIDGPVDSRRIVALALALDRALHDPSTGGVFLRLRRTSLGLAQAQELHQLVAALVGAGKPVVCQFEEPRGSELYACANATRTFIDPAGHVRLVGPAIHVVMLGGLLDRVGVRADFVRVGEYKTAPEQLMNESLSAPGRAQENELVSDLHARLVQDLARDRGIGVAEMSSIIDRGPFPANEAVRLHLVDACADGDALDETLDSIFGRMMRRRAPIEPSIDRSFGIPHRVVVVVVDGSIIDGENLDLPFVDVHASGADTIVAALDRVANDPSVEAVVLRVDSGGGSALASDRIYRAVRRVAARKPVIASLGSTAASGGYYIAAAAREIFSDPSTITGSIGVFYGKVDVEGLANRIGVHVEEFRRGAHAGAESFFRPFTSDEHARLEELVRATYQTFLERVATGRHRTVDAVEPLARGRVYSGDAASRVHLVDRLGGLAAAVARARELGHVDPDSEVVVVPARPRTLFEYLVGIGEHASVSEATRVPGALTHHLENLIVLGTMTDGAVLAMPPFVLGD